MGWFLHWLPEVGGTGNAGAFPDLRGVSVYQGAFQGSIQMEGSAAFAFCSLSLIKHAGLWAGRQQKIQLELHNSASIEPGF